VQPSEISRLVPTVPGMLAVWLLCGALTFCGALVCAELASAFPRSGGVYVFLSETFSPAAGFLWGWAMFWVMHSGIIAALAVVFARYIGYFVPLGDADTRGVAIAGIALLSAVNYAGVRHGSAVQALLTFAKLAAIAAILILVVVLDPGPAATTSSATPAATGFTLREFVLALSAGLFAYGGWHMVTYPAGETRAPEKTIPRALVLGTLIVTVCYLGLNAAYLYVLPVEQVIASTRVAADAAEVLVGPRGGAAISGLVVLSAFGALAGIVLAGPRVYYAMAHDGLVFRWLGAVHPRYHTPHRAVVLQAVWSSALVATGTYRELFTRVIYTEWIFFAAMTAGIFLLRRRAGYRPAYRMWGYPVAPLLFVAAAVAIVANQVWADPRESAIGLALVAAGLPVYYFWARKGAAQGAEANADR
jgi:APA family basic amino acid/polyamine antiporter